MNAHRSVAAPTPQVENATHARQKGAREPSTHLDAGSVYYLTEVGKKLRTKSKAALDEHFVRILSVIEGDTHMDVILGCLRHYTDARLHHWLKKLEIAGAVKTRPSGFVPNLSFPDTRRMRQDYEVALTDTDVMRIDVGALLGAAVLRANSAYLAEERLQNRAPLAKAPDQIVVLLVEDDPEQATLASRQLSLVGYQVRVTESHRTFLAALRDHGVPDAVCLDVELPDGDGFDLLAYVRRHPRLALVPVVMVTAQSESEQIRKGLALGADAYLPKPYSKTTLTDTLRRVLKHT